MIKSEKKNDIIAVKVNGDSWDILDEFAGIVMEICTEATRTGADIEDIAITLHMMADNGICAIKTGCPLLFYEDIAEDLIEQYTKNGNFPNNGGLS